MHQQLIDLLDLLNDRLLLSDKRYTSFIISIMCFLTHDVTRCQCKMTEESYCSLLSFPYRVSRRYEYCIMNESSLGNQNVSHIYKIRIRNANWGFESKKIIPFYIGNPKFFHSYFIIRNKNEKTNPAIYRSLRNLQFFSIGDISG